MTIRTTDLWAILDLIADPARCRAALTEFDLVAEPPGVATDATEGAAAGSGATQFGVRSEAQSKKVSGPLAGSPGQE